MTITINHRSVAWFLAGSCVAAIVFIMFRSLAAEAVSNDETTFVPTTACRLLDTRPAPDRIGPFASLGPDDTRVVSAHGSQGRCTIPTTATGLGLNVTAVGASEPTFMTLWDDGELPLASSLNPTPGAPPTPNAVSVPLSDTGSFRIFNQFGTVDVIVDVTGYYTKTGLQEIDARLADLEELTASMSIETAGGRSTVRFTGVNVQVVDGTGDTGGVPNGRGNLIVGYNEDFGGDETRGGSHNLVVGPDHEYTSYSGVVFGVENEISGAYASVSGGRDNVASGNWSSVAGGSDNTATGSFTAVLGGRNNTAGGFGYATVAGGRSNSATGNGASIVGGTMNDATGPDATVSGGERNTASGSSSSVTGGWWGVASGIGSSVTGGTDNTASAFYASVSGGSNNTASAESASVSGGDENDATGVGASVSGGDSNEASGDQSSVQGGFNHSATGTRSSISGGSTLTVAATDGWDAG